MKFITIALTILLIQLACASIPHYTKKQINELIGGTKINYGSTVRIKANAFNFLYPQHYPAFIHITSTIPEEVGTSRSQVSPWTMTTTRSGPSRKPTENP